MEQMKLSEIVKAVKGSYGYPADMVIDNISTDTRTITQGSVFLALKGARFDGHDFAVKAMELGAQAVITERAVEGARCIIVDSTAQALLDLAGYYRDKFDIPLVGVTGSVGKTTTKDMISLVVAQKYKTLKTQGNLNNEIGMPKTLFGIDNQTQAAVIEMGMSAKGEISYLTDLVKPDIAVITNVYPMHIEFFPSFEAIAYAKAEIFEGLPPNGIAIINEDTNFAPLLKEIASTYTSDVKTFGKNHHPAAEFATQEEGEQYTYNAWCALSVVDALGLDVQKAASYIKDFGALEGRGKRHTLNLTNGTYTLIDDSYSGQPEAMIMAINNLSKMKTNGRKIVVLGKMAELGNTSLARHQEIGKILAQSNVDIVIGVCPETRDMLQQLPANKQQYYFDSKDGVAEFLQNKLLQNGDTVLIKGARYSSQVYKITEELIKRGTTL